MEKHILKAEKRDATAKPKALRAAGLLPANVFGADGSQALSLDYKQTIKFLADISESTVFYLDIAGKQTPVMLAEIQHDPIKNQIIHLALRQVNLNQKVTAGIPVVVTGTFSVPGAYYNLVHDEVEAEALPTDLPESFSIDLSTLKAIGDEVTFADLTYDRAKVTLAIEDEKLPVLVVDEIVEETEEEKPAAAAEAAPADAASADTAKKE